MTTRPSRRSSRRADRGMTLVEVIVTIAVIGAIATVLATAATVTFRQQSTTDGNLDVARWEQALALWLPTDLASTNPSTIDSEPLSTVAADAGCTDPCVGTSNELTLTFDDGSGLTTVSYRYGPDPGGDDDWVMTRVECQAGACSSRVILRDLAPPDDVSSWTPAVGAAETVIAVDTPNKVLDPAVLDLSAVIVTVTVNGQSDGSGVDRSSSVSLTAGGVVLDPLDPPEFDGPDFLEARSGCGGPVTLVIDESGSIAGDASNVRDGVRSFVETFDGTPTRLQVITFADGTDVLDDPAGADPFNRFFDLAEPDEVAELLGYLDQYQPGGGTDWLEALERTFEDESGTPYAAIGDPGRPHPELVVFFTDGLPTVSEFTNPLDPGVTFPANYDSQNTRVFRTNGSSTGYYIDLRDWWLAAEFMRDYRSTTRLVGVGIGESFDGEVRVYSPETWTRQRLPTDVFLGDLIVGGQPSGYSGTRGFQLVEYDSGWGDVSGADVLTATDMNVLGSGLAAIALAECGGTVTVQTRDAAGVPADEDVLYTLLPSDEVGTTSRGRKSATFDVPLDGAPSLTVELVPQDLTQSELNPVGWSCRSAGTSHPFSLRTGDAAGGITLSVTPNDAVSCTLEVS